MPPVCCKNFIPCSCFSSPLPPPPPPPHPYQNQHLQIPIWCGHNFSLRLVFTFSHVLERKVTSCTLLSLQNVENNQSPGRTERVTFLKSIQQLSQEWQQLSQDERNIYKDKAAELHLERKEARRRSREKAQENIRREQLREKAYESLSSLRI